jgi:hypothetical protein
MVKPGFIKGEIYRGGWKNLIIFHYFYKKNNYIYTNK